MVGVLIIFSCQLDADGVTRGGLSQRIAKIRLACERVCLGSQVCLRC